MADFTKQAIRTAFIQLLNEKPYKQITVRDIVDTCGVNRNTFYYHYADIPQLLESIIQQDTQRILAENGQIHSLEDCLQAALAFALENRRAVLHIYRSASRDLYEQYQWRICTHLVSQLIDSYLQGHTVTPTDRQLLIDYVKCVLFGVIMDWLERGMRDDILAQAHRMCTIKAGELERMVTFCEAHPDQTPQR